MTSPPDAEQPDARPPSKKKQIIATIVTLLVLFIVFFRIFPQFADYSDAWDAIQGMSTTVLWVLGIVTVVNVLVYVWPFTAALPGLPFSHGFVVRQTSFAISNGIPAGGAFGLGVQYAMLASYGYGSGPATAAIGITSVWNLLVTLGLPVFGLLAIAATGEIPDWATTAALIGLVAVVGGVVILTAIFRSEALTVKIGTAADRAVAWFGRLFRQEWEFGIVHILEDFRSSTVDVVQGRALMITVANILQQFVQFLVLFIALRGIQGGVPMPVTFAEALAAFSVGRLGSFIPVTPGGIGTVDAVITALLVGFGVSNADAVAATLVWRAATYFPQMFIGIGTFLYWRAREARAARRAGA